MIVCQEDLYLLELTRYIHLNPLRAGLIPDLEGLSRYPWAGHSALTGQVERDWQDTVTIHGYFAGRRKEAVRRYKAFFVEGVSLGRRPELAGVGLIRSLGGWSQVLSLWRKGLPMIAFCKMGTLWSRSSRNPRNRIKKPGEEGVRRWIWRPYLEPEDIKEALRYAAETVRKRELPLLLAW